MRVEHFRNEDGNELYQLVEVHGRAPLPLPNGTVIILIKVVASVYLVLLTPCRNDVVQQITTVCKTWLAELKYKASFSLTVVLVIITGG